MPRHPLTYFETPKYYQNKNLNFIRNSLVRIICER